MKIIISWKIWHCYIVQPSPPPIFLRVGGWASYQIFEKGGLTGSQFWERVAGKQGVTFFMRRVFCSFFKKKETKIWNISWQKIVKKEGLGQFPNLRGWGRGCLAKNSRWCWGRVDTLMHTMHSGTHVSTNQFHIVISHWTCGRNVGEDFLWIQYEIF